MGRAVPFVVPPEQPVFPYKWKRSKLYFVTYIPTDVTVKRPLARIVDRDIRWNVCNETQSSRSNSPYYHLRPSLKRDKFCVKFYLSNIKGLFGYVSLLTNETLAVMS